MLYGITAQAGLRSPTTFSSVQNSWVGQGRAWLRVAFVRAQGQEELGLPQPGCPGAQAISCNEMMILGIGLRVKAAGASGAHAKPLLHGVPSTVLTGCAAAELACRHRQQELRGIKNQGDGNGGWTLGICAALHQSPGSVPVFQVSQPKAPFFLLVVLP